MHEITPVIMCGGSGTRLWPASRESMPKQFIAVGGKGYSTFQLTARRVAGRKGFGRPVVLGSADFRFIIAEQLIEAGVDADIVLEPMRRDSAAAVAVAACHTADRGGAVLIMASDHLIDDDDAFAAVCLAGLPAAMDGRIVTIGIRPTAPATSYGYIRPADPIPETAAFAVGSFVEKPDLERAKAYVTEGYFWNAGYFLFRPDVMLAELDRFQPAIAAAARATVEKATVDLDFVRLDPDSFAIAPKTSIDYAVMEHTALAAVVPAGFGWSDIGSWDAMWDVLPRDAAGNAAIGDVLLVNTRNSLVQSDSILTAVIGLDDVVVVATADAVLVSDRKSSEKVKELVGVLRAGGRREADEHLRMHRPWGWYQRVDLGERFQVKRIMVKPGARLSLQRHFHRAEHWVVVRGTAEVTVGETVRLLHENESVQIAFGEVHRLGNPGRIPLELIEVQVGSYTGEDDIVRLEDNYRRI